MKKVLLSDKCHHAYYLVKNGMSPTDAWIKTIERLYDKKQWRSQFQHSCPKWAFAVLCNRGYLKGVEGGCCPQAELSKSAALAIEAINMFLKYPEYQDDKKRLSALVYQREGMKPRKDNGEVGVLLYFIAQGHFDFSA